MPPSRLPLALAVAALVVALGGFVVHQQFLAGDDVARLTLAPAASSSADPTSTGDSSSDPSASEDPSTGIGTGTATAAEASSRSRTTRPWSS